MMHERVTIPNRIALRSTNATTPKRITHMTYGIDWRQLETRARDACGEALDNLGQTFGCYRYVGFIASESDVDYRPRVIKAVASTRACVERARASAPVRAPCARGCEDCCCADGGCSMCSDGEGGLDG